MAPSGVSPAPGATPANQTGSAWTTGKGAAPELTDREFYDFCRLIHRHAGIQLSAQKKELVRSRLAKILRSRNLTSFAHYYQEVLADRTGRELVSLLDAISTNQTAFWREPAHFLFLAREVLPEWRQSLQKPPAWRFWSAGCASGEEPYTLAMTLLETFGARETAEVKILASDLNTQVLAQARQGVYPLERLAPLPPEWRRRYFQKGVNHFEGFARLKEGVRRLVEFIRLNFMEPFHFSEEFDVIFCRNVMIYFDRQNQQRLVGQFHQCLRPGGYLFIGHSESLCNIKHPFTYVGPTIYRK
jgi:chemotaxis protein methyltransferase CheR